MDSTLLFGLRGHAGGWAITESVRPWPFSPKPRIRPSLLISMGFSAGVMIYLSFVEIIPNQQRIWQPRYRALRPPATPPSHWSLAWWFMAIIDALVPSAANPHENTQIELIGSDQTPLDIIETASNKALLRMVFSWALAIAIHNFPEGLATFLLVLDDPEVGIAMRWQWPFTIFRSIAVSVAGLLRN